MNMNNNLMNRREALFISAGATVALAVSTVNAALTRKMTLNLMCGMIGVQANQRTAIELAAKHGFESVEAMPNDLAKLSASELTELRDLMKAKCVVFGAASLGVEFRQDESRFREGIASLPRLAAALERAGVTRAGTWLTAPTRCSRVTVPLRWTTIASPAWLDAAHQRW